MPITINELKEEQREFKYSILSVNICSYNRNKEQLKSLVDQINPTIVCLTEMWAPYNPNLRGYQNPTLNLRQKKRGGGIGIFCRNNITVRLFSENKSYATNFKMSSNSCESHEIH